MTMQSRATPTESPTSRHPCESPRWWGTLSGALLLMLCGLAAYQNSFKVPFLFDDFASIPDNPHIRRLWPLWDALSAPPQESTTGRPILCLSLALNYAVGGLEVWSYHAFNLICHFLAALTLWGIVRRTLLLEPLRARFGHAATPLSLLVALLWLVHPLQTESVTYLIQRAELLMGLFFLLTLYSALRGMTAPRRAGLWYAAAVLACALGMGSKEVTAMAPLAVLLYDRTFIARSWREVWRGRARLYLGLFSTWGIFIALAWSGPRSGSVGFGFGNIGPLDYARTQCQVILHYIRLCFWPSPLVFDYGWPIVRSFAACAWQGTVLLALLAAVATLLYWRPAWGFVGAWFFLILGPSSSFVPIVTETAAEHRMYLPVATLIVATVIGGFLAIEALAQRRPGAARAARAGGILAAGAAAALLGFLTWQRNNDYQTEVGIWEDTVRKSPYNARAHMNLGSVLGSLNRMQEAGDHSREALRLQPGYPDALNNLGYILKSEGRIDESIEVYQEALRNKPDFPQAQYNLGLMLHDRGQNLEAVEHFNAAIRLKPDYDEAYNGCASALMSLGRSDEAVEHFKRALALNPANATAHYNLGTLLLTKSRYEEAYEQMRQALRYDPTLAEAHGNWATALVLQGRLHEAIEHFNRALEIKPNMLIVCLKLAWLLATHPPAEGGDPARSLQLAQRAMRLTGGQDAQSHDALAAAYAALGRFPEAIESGQKALKLAIAAGRTQHASDIQRRLELYQAGKPYYEPIRKPAAPGR